MSADSYRRDILTSLRSFRGRSKSLRDDDEKVWSEVESVITSANTARAEFEADWTKDKNGVKRRNLYRATADALDEAERSLRGLMSTKYCIEPAANTLGDDYTDEYANRSPNYRLAMTALSHAINTIAGVTKLVLDSTTYAVVTKHNASFIDAMVLDQLVFDLAVIYAVQTGRKPSFTNAPTMGPFPKFVAVVTEATGQLSTDNAIKKAVRRFLRSDEAKDYFEWTLLCRLHPEPKREVSVNLALRKYGFVPESKR